MGEFCELGWVFEVDGGEVAVGHLLFGSVSYVVFYGIGLGGCVHCEFEKSSWEIS